MAAEELNATVNTIASGIAELLAQIRITILHELGHLVGLDHVEDRTQVMYHAESTTPPTASTLITR